MHLSAEVWLALGVFECEEHTELFGFGNFIIFGCRATLLTVAPLSYVSYMSYMTPYQ